MRHILTNCYKAAIITQLIILSTAPLVSQALPKEESLSFHASHYDNAKKANSYLRFDVTHRSVAGLISSTVNGYVKDFAVNGSYDSEKLDLSHAIVSFQVFAMDTNNGTRDGMMHKDTLKGIKYPGLQVAFSKTLKLGTQTVPAVMTVLGAKNNINVTVTITDAGQSFLASGSAKLSLNALGIPSPKLLVKGIASVDDSIKILYQISVKKKEL